MNGKPMLYIVYNGEVDPHDTADASILGTLSGDTTDQHLKDIDIFYEKIPHTIVQYEVSGAQLINGRVYGRD